MKLTESMIHAAVDKACELGILPRKSIDDDLATNSEIIIEILEAALKTEIGSDSQDEF